MSGSDGARLSDLATLYERHSDWLMRKLVQRYGRQDAEDIHQDTWLRLTRKGELEVQRPKAFLLKVASHLAIDRFREGRRAQVADTSNQHCALRGEQPPTQAATVILTQVVIGLPQPLRDVFVLSRFGGLTNAQIAEQLGISPKTVEWRMTKALAHCAAQLRA
ncbi:MAG: RNA polymerase sigma factor [Brevundimonas sp.]|nr:RNA polymerase sigma factor [Brevundimonas sp.]